MFIFKRGKYYYVQYTDEAGKTKRVSTGTLLKFEAHSFLQNLEKNLEAKKKVTPVTLEEFRIEYVEYMKLRFSEAYVQRSVKVGLSFLINALGNIPLTALEPKKLEMLLLKKSKFNKYAAANIYRTMSAAFKRAVAWGYLKNNPLENIEKPKTLKKLPLIITEEDIEKIFVETPSKVLRLMFLFVFHTGLRLSEVINLRWDSIDLKNYVLTVQSNDGFVTKNKSDRRIPLNKTALRILQELKPKIIMLNDYNYIFSKPTGERYLGDHVSKTFKRAVRKGGVDYRYRFHDLRHAFASRLIRKGASLIAVRDLLGHADIATTQIYSHTTFNELTEVMKNLELEHQQYLHLK